MKNLSQHITNGYFIANKYGTSVEFNIQYNLYYMFIFNDNGIVAYIETENEPYNLSIEEHQEFMNYKNYDVLSNCSRYETVKNNIKMRFYEPDSPMAHEKGEINPKNYKEWVGTFTEDNLILSLHKSYFNHSLGDYTIDCLFKDLKFQFHKL
jgi:hypothetical protein